jgi:hypothetical protein
MYVGMLEWGGFFQHGKITFVECMVVGLKCMHGWFEINPFGWFFRDGCMHAWLV